MIRKKHEVRKKSEPKQKYNVPADGSGYTPRQLVDLRRGQLLSLEIAEKRKLLIPKDEVESEMAETNEIFRNDLGALPDKLALKLSGRTFTIQEARAIIAQGIREMVLHWQEAELVGERAMPK